MDTSWRKLHEHLTFLCGYIRLSLCASICSHIWVRTSQSRLQVNNIFLKRWENLALDRQSIENIRVKKTRKTMEKHIRSVTIIPFGSSSRPGLFEGIHPCRAVRLSKLQCNVGVKGEQFYHIYIARWQTRRDTGMAWIAGTVPPSDSSLPPITSRT